MKKKTILNIMLVIIVIIGLILLKLEKNNLLKNDYYTYVNKEKLAKKLKRNKYNIKSGSIFPAKSIAAFTKGVFSKLKRSNRPIEIPNTKRATVYGKFLPFNKDFRIAPKTKHITTKISGANNAFVSIINLF